MSDILSEYSGIINNFDTLETEIMSHIDNINNKLSSTSINLDFIIQFLSGYKPTIFGRYGGAKTSATLNQCIPMEDSETYTKVGFVCNNNYPELVLSSFEKIDITNLTKLTVSLEITDTNPTADYFNNVKIGISDSNINSPSIVLNSQSNISNINIVDLVLDISSYTGEIYPSIWLKKGYPSGIITMIVTKFEFS